jgi:predicted nucleic acid-binding Zn ribbon protein
MQNNSNKIDTVNTAKKNQILEKKRKRKTEQFQVQFAIMSLTVMHE